MATLFKRPEIIRPPSEWRSYYLPLTIGCSNNTCTFCNFHGRKLQVRDLDEVRREIDAVALFVQRGLYVTGMPDIVYAVSHSWDGKMVFLQDGDALVYPALKLKEVLQYINQKLPTVETISAYATAQDILRIGYSTLKELRLLKLGILYMGLESGDDEVLWKVAKGVVSKQIIEAGRLAKEAGILISATVILGLAGFGGSEKHALETARALTEIDPDYVGALTLTLVPGTPLYREWQQGNFLPISPMQSLQELAAIITRSQFTNCFFSSMHASNYFAVRGRLPEDKELMILQLRRIIGQGDPSALRPDFLRGL